MHAVWSHWSKPLRGTPGNSWLDIKHYLMSFVLSHALAKQHFQETHLVTDSEGLRVIVDIIGLDFDHVFVELDTLNPFCLCWWNLGKFYAYSMQTKPFIHLDNDVFLWNPIPKNLLQAPVFAQNPEYFGESSDYYRLIELEQAIDPIKLGWLPQEWRWARHLYGNFQKSMNTGIYGGNRPDFIRYVADLAFSILQHPGNQRVLENLEEKTRIIGMLEMYLPLICMEYHSNFRKSAFHNVRIEYLFSSAEDAFQNGNNRGYTHILGGAKRELQILARLEQRVQYEYPIYYKRCIEFSESNPNYLGSLPDTNL